MSSARGVFILIVCRVSHAIQVTLGSYTWVKPNIRQQYFLNTLCKIGGHTAHFLPDNALIHAEFPARTGHIAKSLSVSRAAGERPVGDRLTGRRFHLPNIGAQLP